MKHKSLKYFCAYCEEEYPTMYETFVCQCLEHKKYLEDKIWNAQFVKE